MTSNVQWNITLQNFKKILRNVLSSHSSVKDWVGWSHIGQLYDAKNGQLVHDKFLWTNPVVVNEAIITSTETETLIEETLRDRMSLLDFSASIKATLIKIITVS